MTVVYPQDRTCPYHPPAAYDPLRDGAPMHRVRLFNGGSAWVITRYELARGLLADRRLSSDRSDPGFPVTAPRFEAFRKFPRRTLIGMDEPEHGRYRRMLISEFAVRRIRAMRPEIEEVVRTFLDGMLAAGPPADLVSAFSLPVPSMVICRLLGVPYEDHDFFQAASRHLVHARTAAESLAAREELDGYIGGLVDRKGFRPGLLRTLMEGPYAAGEMNREDLLSVSMLLLVAGHETTASMISLGVITLLEHPEQLAVLRAEPEAMVTAVEELLRFLSIADLAGMRVATADIDVGGRTIAAGEGVIVANSLGNRDGGAFPDPDRFDVRRPARHHLAFGYGVHQCLGQNLARAELEIALTALFDRIPGLCLAAPVEELPLRPGDSIQGVDRLPVTW